MSDDLYFIPLIAEALRQADAKTAMRQAFRQIQAMGQEPRYRIGYQQFLSFMESARQSPQEHGPDELGSEILKAVERPTTVALLLEKGGAVLATCSFERGLGTQTIGRVQPGDYRLTADSGRVLWTGSLTEQDLLWASASPGQGLPLAADTGESRRQPTREIDLLDGTLVLRVYPGIEAGVLEITLKARGEKS